jgi:hypothetical protein
MSEAERITQIEARLEAATPGPWELDEIPETGECGVFGGPNFWYSEGHAMVCANAYYDDAGFIANAREDIPYLLAALRAAEAREQEAKAIGWDEAVIKTLAAVNGSIFDLAYVAANNPYRSAPTEQENRP